MESLIFGLFLVLAVIVAFLLPLSLVRKQLRELKARGLKFNYGITDIWAAILALTPSIFLAARLIHYFEAHVAVLLFFGLAGQCIGIILGKVRFALHYDRPAIVVSASHILAYSVGFGINMVILFLISLPAVAIAIPAIVILSPCALAYIILRFDKSFDK